MKRRDDTLTDLYRDFVAQRSEESRKSCASFDGKNRRYVAALATRGIFTIPELIAALPDLPPKLKNFGIWWFQVSRDRRAEKTLLQMMWSDETSRLYCAATLASIGGSRSLKEFVRIGKTQLASDTPDRHWLDAAIQFLKLQGRLIPEAEEILLSIYERKDLPGWVRGDAGDALGCCSGLQDRRTRFFRRAWDAARDGLFDDDIEVQFWSMYVIMMLAGNHSNPRRSNSIFAEALPQLRKIAATDHRLAPGYWWPMSAEAEDAIYEIEHGNGRENDASTRWLGNKERHPMIRD